MALRQLLFCFKFTRGPLRVDCPASNNAMLCYAKSLQLCLTLCDPIDGSHQAPLFLGFSRQEYCHALLQGIFPTQESNPCLLYLFHCRWILYPLSHLGSPCLVQSYNKMITMYPSKEGKGTM